jgi:hypothetical protein
MDAGTVVLSVLDVTSGSAVTEGSVDLENGPSPQPRIFTNVSGSTPLVTLPLGRYLLCPLAIARNHARCCVGGILYDAKSAPCDSILRSSHSVGPTVGAAVPHSATVATRTATYHRSTQRDRTLPYGPHRHQDSPARALRRSAAQRAAVRS